LVSFHAWAESLHATKHQPSVERRARESEGVDEIRDALGVLLVARNDGAADDVGMAVQVLRRRRDDVDTVLERSLGTARETCCRRH
jgi:hypothetical protein